MEETCPKLWFGSGATHLKGSQGFLVSMVKFRVVYMICIPGIHWNPINQKMQEISPNRTSYHPTLPAPNHKVRKKFRGYFRGTCSDLSNATMEVGEVSKKFGGEVSQGWWGRIPETCDKRFVFFFVWKRKEIWQTFHLYFCLEKEEVGKWGGTVSIAALE